MNKKALVAMSGGVDSSVAALVAKQNGYECIGATMKFLENDDYSENVEKTCCSLSDVEDARSVCYKIDIPYYVFNFTTDFKKEIIDRFIKSYEHGQTPNPCIDCNRYMKFDKFLIRAKQLEIDYVVTGHYANIEFDKTSNRYLLKKGLDSSKDQSYVLYSLTQEQLKHTLLPLGNLEKSQVREIANEYGFTNSYKKDSQDICFVKNGDYVNFIKQYTGQNYPSGPFVDLDGNTLGTHKGIISYTIGQRKGLGISSTTPLYVHSKNTKDNTVVLSDKSNLYSNEIIVNDFNWIAFDNPQKEFYAEVKIRYKLSEQPAKITPLSEKSLKIEFKKPQRAISPGQAAVIYDGNVVIGGGTIIK